MAAYILLETRHTFGPSMLYPVYRSVVFATQISQEGNHGYLVIMDGKLEK